MDRKIKDARSRPLALASIFICESLLLELASRKLVGASDVQGLLKDAAKALAANGTDGEDFLKASELIEAIREQYERLPDPGTVS
jgi:hypothetical protein